jgi:hypothetical protein
MILVSATVIESRFVICIDAAETMLGDAPGDEDGSGEAANAADDATSANATVAATTTDRW